MTFGEILKELMQKDDLTQSRLGYMIGVSRSTISDYVTGKRLPNFEVFNELQSIFNSDALFNAWNNEINEPEDIPTIPFTTREIVIRNNLEENKLIAHALVYVVAAFEEEGLQALAPNDYWAYKILVEKYKPYLN